MRILKRDRVVRSGAPRLKNRQRETLSGLLFFLPWVIGFLAITCYPLIYSIVISFNQVAIRPGEVVLEPVGWEYFRQALFLDTEFPTLLVASVTQVAIGTPISVVFALVMALLLNRGFKGRTVYRMIFFMPVIIMSGPVMSELMTETSAMSIDMDLMGLNAILMELDKGWSLLLLKVLNSFIKILWFCGVQIIVFLVALQKIDGSMYEAASIDGAGKFTQFRKITLPFVVFSITPVLIGQFVGNFNNFGIYFFLRSGLQSNYADYFLASDTDLLINWLYNLSVSNNYYSIGAAISLVIFVITGTLSLIVYVRSAAYKREETFQ